MVDRHSSVALRTLGTVATVAELAAINTTILKNGASVFVTSLQDSFFLLKDSTTTPDGSAVVQSATGSAGRWFRMFTGGESSWATQSEWYVDPLNGSDSNKGDTNTMALATMAELTRRIGSANINQKTNVHILNDVPDDDYFYGPYSFGLTGQLLFNGENAQVLASPGALTARVLPAPATNTRPSITIAGFDFSPYVGKRVRVTAGNNVGIVAFIEAIGGSTDTAFVNQPVDLPSFSTSAFTVGDTIVIEELTRIGGFGSNATYNNTYDFQEGGPIVWNDLSFQQTGNERVLSMGCQFAAYGCDMLATDYRFDVFYPVGTKLAGVRCIARSMSWFGGTSQVSQYNNCGLLIIQDNTSSVGRVRLQGGTHLQVASSLGWSIWDWSAGAGLVVDFGSSVAAFDYVWGTSAVANTYGIQIRPSAYMAYDNAEVPTIAGALSGTKAAEVGLVDIAAIVSTIDPATNAALVEAY